MSSPPAQQLNGPRSPRTFLKRFNSTNQDHLAQNTSRSFSNNFNRADFSVEQDRRKLIQQLEKIAKQQKSKRQEIQIRYQQFKQRNMLRQKEFYKILGKFDEHLFIEPSKEGTSNKDEIYINEIYQKILCTFEAFNQKARELLQDRYSQLYRLMQRRIDILMQKMDKQLSKYRKLKQSQLRQIRDSVKQMAVIAADIENQNIEIRKKCDILDLKNKLLSEEKRLLLQEVMMNKMSFTRQLKYMKRQNNEEKKQYQENTQNRGKQVNSDRGEQLNKKSNNQSLNIQFWKGLQSIQIENTLQHNNVSIIKRPHSGRGAHHQKPHSNSGLKFNQTLNSSQNQKNQKQKFDKNTVAAYNIITHLKSCLQRQKAKNLQLVKFSLEIQTKQSKIKQLIDKEIERQKTCASSSKTVQNALQMVSEKQNINQQIILMKEFENLSQIILEINKILHLPQVQAKTTDEILTYDDMVGEIQVKDHNDRYKQLKSNGNNNINNSPTLNIFQNKNTKTSISQKPQRKTPTSSSSNRYRYSPHANYNQFNKQITSNNFSINVSAAGGEKQKSTKQSKQKHQTPRPFTSIQEYSRNSGISKWTREQSAIVGKKSVNNNSKIYNPETKIQKQKQRRSSLFAHYSPLDIVDITKSIQIK